MSSLASSSQTSFVLGSRAPESNSAAAAGLGEPDAEAIEVITPSHILNDRPGKRDLQSGKVRKWKPKPKVKQPTGGICYILALPEDVMRLLLGRMPPRSLRALSQTCAGLRAILDDDSIWKDCYVYGFLQSIRPRDVRREMDVLVQGCLGAAGRGWRREALGRESMLERWTTSKATPVTHTPSVGLIHTLSLSYPPPLAVSSRGLVGKNAEQDAIVEQSPAAPKLTARQKYDARIAATTRLPPHVLTAGLGPGAIVKSDPLSAKVSKGFWGPGRDANFHIHPQFNHVDPPSAIHLPLRSQTYALWGQPDGSVVHTSLETKHPSAAGNRAQSVNTTCDVQDRHDGEVVDVHASASGETLRFVTAGSDGVAKYWQYDPPEGGKGSKRKGVGGTMSCLFASSLVEPLDTRPEALKYARAINPDPIVLVRCDADHDVVCAVTGDGDLRVWIGVTEESPREVRVDVGSTDDIGAYQSFELDARGESISVMLARRDEAFFTRYDVDLATLEVAERRYITPLAAPLTAFRALLSPSAPITAPSRHRRSSNEDDAPAPVQPKAEYGRLVVAGDQAGSVWIWPWDDAGPDVSPIRGWAALDRKVTALDYHCGLVAVGGCDTFIKVFDPLPAIPALLRQFRAAHLGAADLAMAESDDPNAAWHTVNQVVLENDLFVAAVGRRIFAWRAGSVKKADAAKSKGKGGQPGRVARGMDWRSLREDVRDERLEQQAAAEAATPSRSAVQQSNMMDEMGLDADDALQYAMMLSMEETSAANSSLPSPRTEEDYERGWADDAGDLYGVGEDDMDEVDEAIRAVEEFKRAEEEEMRRAMETIEMADRR